MLSQSTSCTPVYGNIPSFLKFFLKFKHRNLFLIFEAIITYITYLVNYILPIIKFVLKKQLNLFLNKFHKKADLLSAQKQIYIKTTTNL